METKYQTKPLFPSVIHMIEMRDWDREGIIETAYILQNEDQKGNSYSNLGGWQSTQWSTDSLINQTIKEALRQTFCTILHPHWKLKQSYWININPKGAFNVMHCHPEAHWSGVMWVKVPENSGDFVLESPSAFEGAMEAEHTDLNYRLENNIMHSCNIRPKEGTLLVFPSHIHHGVNPNTSDEDRISIAFNIRLTDGSFFYPE